MLVQTLVENAVKHGIASLKAGGVIHLAARVRTDRLEVTVSNSGRFLPPASGSGHGLVNASERLALLYGGAASLRVAGTEGGETVASLTLPLEIA
jgi:LytS/YehU family sensor histidine kinase